MLKNCVVYSLNRTCKQSFILRYLLLFSTAPQQLSKEKIKTSWGGWQKNKIEKVWLERLVISGRLGEIDEVGSEKGQSERWPFRAVTCLRQLLSLGNAKSDWFTYILVFDHFRRNRDMYLMWQITQSLLEVLRKISCCTYVCRHSVVNHCLKN